MIKLVINADDYGKNEICSRAILEFLENKLITNTTLIVNMPYSKEAMNLAREKRLDGYIGFHLNLTQGMPLTESIKRFSVFCGEDGLFNANFHRSLRTRLWLPREARQALREEINAQIDKYLELGGKEMHLDSHHHSHSDFSIAHILYPIAKQKGFRTCRLSRDTRNGTAKIIYKIIFNWYTRLFFKVCDVFTDEASILANSNEYEGKTIEIMTHPIRTLKGEIDPEDALKSGVLGSETRADDLRSFLIKLRGFYKLESFNEV